MCSRAEMAVEEADPFPLQGLLALEGRSPQLLSADLIGVWEVTLEVNQLVEVEGSIANCRTLRAWACHYFIHPVC